ncbi:S-adenosylmethionine synthase [Anaerocolumna cellulosilytica]|uniref:S-adenosylmethionine synthase n=1 Tax=Anaerocolumna cellulosilytica TaxID=433286 RepID=A0A6S6R4Y2_9FIRM|nr:methionine adenosyltransferase [Anaerocolumna cellulosilytica]MBB5194896.1 S-adenosylmethionine synthetase [Anaerocolumna cellulosilytica]BCJ94141.1 S-adenosylmethionine synthase [Anaerocolumna cellulosilytica]
MKNNYLFTSESVTSGHPDKMCDMISDAVLDAYIEQDPYSRVACEVSATTGIVLVMGEITSTATVNISKVVRETIKDIGYIGEKFGFNAETCAIISAIDKQSEDISLGVNNSFEHRQKETKCSLCDNCLESDEYDIIGAGDQGIMFGYACNETETLMPAPIYYAHKISERLNIVRSMGILDYLGPDGKSMVTFEYDGNKPVRIDTIVVSVQHLSEILQEKIHADINNFVIGEVIPKNLIDENTKIYINPTGRFVKGGPCADTGLTGRKIIVDTYGGVGRHGGGAFSGKDPTKVDRTGAYAARYVAKNIVAANIAEKFEVQIAYAIGHAYPVSIHVNTFGTSSIADDKIVKMIYDLFDLRPASLINQFNMRKPIYKKLAAYGHLGRNDIETGWEQMNRVNDIKEYFHIS